MRKKNSKKRSPKKSDANHEANSIEVMCFIVLIFFLVHQKFVIFPKINTIIKVLADHVVQLRLFTGGGQTLARKRRHSKTDKVDILLELDKRGMLRSVSQVEWGNFII